MSTYLEKVKMAFFIFPVLALVISGIIFIYEYRKYGRFIVSRGIVLYSFIFYLLCAYFQVILPLPPRAEVAQLTTATVNLDLFHSWQEFFSQSGFSLGNPETYLPAMKSFTFLEPVLNVLLVLPFGVYLRYYFRLSLPKTIAASFLLSLFFEVTQLSGLYFIYPRPYRLFDVDDLLHNTVGGMLGYIIAPVITFMLPSRESMDKTAYQKGNQVTITRRFFAFLIDWFVIGIASFIIQRILSIIPTKIGWISTQQLEQSFLWFAAEVIVYFMVFAWITNGRTVGKSMVRIQLQQENKQRVTFMALVIRYGLFYLVLNGIARFLPALLTMWDNQIPEDMRTIYLGFAVLIAVFFMLVALNVLYAVVTRKRLFFYETISHTYHVSTVQTTSKQR